MDQKELTRWRKKIGISRPGSYTSQRHPKAPKRPQYIGVNNKLRYARPIKAPESSFRRMKFTQSEMEAMWIAVCKVFDYVGGSKKLLSELSGLSYHLINRYVKAGRFTADAAHIIGNNPDFPFSREELRPDISQAGWDKFDVYFKEARIRRSIHKYKTAQRIE